LCFVEKASPFQSSTRDSDLYGRYTISSLHYWLLSTSSSPIFPHNMSTQQEVTLKAITLDEVAKVSSLAVFAVGSLSPSD
jgi:hypothetical protein